MRDWLKNLLTVDARVSKALRVSEERHWLSLLLKVLE